MTIRPLRILTVASLAAFVALGCSSDSGDGNGGGSGGSGGTVEPQGCSALGEDYPITVGITKSSSEGLTVELSESSPAPPELFDNKWTVTLSDGAGPMAGATVTVDTWMPDHGHPSPKTVSVTEIGDGKYELFPVNLFMPGLWEVTVNVEDGAGSSDSVTFQFCMSS